MRYISKVHVTIAHNYKPDEVYYQWQYNSSDGLLTIPLWFKEWVSK